MLIRRVAAILAVLLLLAATAVRANAGRPPEEVLRAIEAEGRRIALYGEAIVKAREAFDRQAPEGSQSDGQVVVARKDGWHVIFLQDHPSGDWKEPPFMVAEVVFNPAVREVSSYRHVPDSRKASRTPFAHLRAIEVARAGATAREEAISPFDASVFLEPGQPYTVYLMGARSDDGTVRFGGDLRVTVKRTPMSVEAIESLHAEATAVQVPDRPTDEPTVHTHRDRDLPTATDVALVLKNPNLAPHLVLTPNHIFRIDPAGAIAYLGPSGIAAVGDGGPD